MIQQFKSEDYRKVFTELGYEFSWDIVEKKILCNGESMTDQIYSSVYCRIHDIDPRLTISLRRQISFAATQNPYNPYADLPARLHNG